MLRSPLTACVFGRKPFFRFLLLVVGANLNHPQAATESARSADSFVDGLGVAVHLTYGHYSDRWESTLQPRLLEIGLRHIRTDMIGDETNIRRVNALAKLGVKTTLITGPGSDIGALKEMVAGVEAVEGPNEPDNWPVTYQGIQGWGAIKPYQVELFNAVKNDLLTKSVHVLTASIGGPEWYREVGNLAPWCDYANLHFYTPSFGEHFGRPAPPTDGLHIGRGGKREMGLLSLAKTLAPGKPMIVTEAGYSTRLVASDWDAGVTERAAARYIPRMLLELLNHGVERGYIYELYDQEGNDMHGGLGMLRADGSLKPHAAAIRNMIRILEDPGPAFRPDSLEFSLAAAIAVRDDLDHRTDEIHHSLLQKRDGRFYLILWHETAGFNPDTDQDILVPDQTVTLQLTAQYGLARIFNPLLSKEPQSQFSGVQTLTLKVPDHPIIVELTRANPNSIGSPESPTGFTGLSALTAKVIGKSGSQASILHLNYNVQKAGWVEITIHDARGAGETILIKRFHQPGMHAWNAPLRVNGRNTGVHWLRMRSGGTWIGGARILIP